MNDQTNPSDAQTETTGPLPTDAVGEQLITPTPDPTEPEVETSQPDAPLAA